MSTKISELTNAVLACLFAALIAVGAFIAIPVPGSPIPLVLQNMLIMLAALVLGPAWGTVSIALYLFFGLLGMPVFSAGSGGLAALLGPTGGYLFGYLPAAALMGAVAVKGGRKVFPNILACILGEIVIYAAGLLRLHSVLGSDWGKTLAAGLYPFLIGDAIKLAVASLLAPKIHAGVEILRNRDDDA